MPRQKNFQTHGHNGGISCNLRSNMITVITQKKIFLNNPINFEYKQGFFVTRVLSKALTALHSVALSVEHLLVGATIRKSTVFE